jgi:hypothetical protein
MTNRLPATEIAPSLLPSKDVKLEHILECAVVLSWNNLVHAGGPSSVHVEYHMGDDQALEYLKVWSSPRRGHWDLVCEYWRDASPSRAAGLRFSNGCSSERLAQILTLAMEHQDTSSGLPDSYRDGMVQVYPPSEQERAAATAWMTDTFEGFVGTAAKGAA